MNQKNAVALLPLLLILIFPLIPLLKYDIFLSWADWKYAGSGSGTWIPNLYVLLISFLQDRVEIPYDLRFLSPLLLSLSAFIFFLALRKNESEEITPYLSLLILPLIPGFIDSGLVLNPSTLALVFFAFGLLFSFNIYGAFCVTLLLFFTDVRVLLLFFTFMIIGLNREKMREKKIMILLFLLFLLLLWKGLIDSSLLTLNVLTAEKIVGNLGYVPSILASGGLLFSCNRRMKFLLLFSFLLYVFANLPASFVALPVSYCAAQFLERVLPQKKAIPSITLILLFWIALSAPFFYVDRVGPQAQDTESFLFAQKNTLQGNIMTGWFYAPVSSFIVKRDAVGTNREGKNIYEKQFYEKMDVSLLDRLYVRYVYYGAHEAYDYPSQTFSSSFLDKIYAGKGGLYDMMPEKVFVVITIDTEEDLPPVLATYRGVEEGIPRILSLLEAYNARATFFVSGDVIERYPHIVKEISKRNEVGLHGMYHEKFTTLSDIDKERRVVQAMRVYEQVLGKNPTSFRAPGHSADTSLVTILDKRGFLVEASGSKLRDYPYHPSYSDWNVDGEMRILRVPVSHVPQYFYASMLWEQSWVEAFRKAIVSEEGKTKVVVIGMHSWEFVSLEAPGYETYTRVTGDYTYDKLRELLDYLREKNVRFIGISELVKIFPSFSRIC
jgi:peptidoglycan/xylan/chitin deacetylase (PgdA/CDA1 family)